MTLTHLNPEQFGRGLSLTGGGVRGVFTASALSQFEAKIHRPLDKCFDVICGTSVGGIVAIALACEIPAKTISEIFFKNIGSIFGNPAGLNPKNLRTARHSQDNLKSTIQQVLGPQAETRIRDLEKNLIVTSVDAIENRVVYFSNQKKIGDTACEDATLVDIALATSAAPTFFPPHLIEERYFLDGGIVSNNPDLETLRFLTSVLSRPVESSMVLSVGTGQTTFDFNVDGWMGTGGYSWLNRNRIIDRIIALQESKSSDLVAGLLGTRYLRVDALLNERIELDETDPTILDRLREQAIYRVDETWKANPSRISGFFR